jgi:predicted  nucleic acid-binding Zn-ribbon protein
MSEKKAGGFMKLLNSVGLADEVPSPSHEAPPPTRGASAPVMPAGATVLGAITPTPTAGPDPEVLAKLEARLQKNCPPAYASFMEQYEALQDVIPDETTRFKAALKTSHLTTPQLVEALGQLAGTMESAHQDFQHQLEGTRAAKIGAVEASIKDADAQIAAHEEQLTALRAKREADMQTLHTETVRIETVRASFETAYAHVLSRLTAQKSRVQNMGA